MPKDKYVKIRPETLDQEDLFNLISSFDYNNTKMNEYKKEADNFKSDLKTIASDTYLQKYIQDGENPGSLIIEAENSEGDTAQYIYVPNDRYAMIRSEKQADFLNEKYGDIVEKNLTHTINPEMLEKYGELISRIIFESDEIENEDKGKIFNSVETYSIKEGTIDRLHEIGDDIEELFENLKPVVSIKSSKIIKS